MSRNITEHNYKPDEDDYKVSPAAEKVLDHIRNRDPQLEETLLGHARDGINHRDAAFTNENTTWDTDDHNGASAQVMNHQSAAYRIFESVRDSLGQETTQEARKQAASDLMQMMCTPYHEGLAALPPEQHLIRSRLTGRLNSINDEAVGHLVRESGSQSRTGEQFCDRTESLRGLSRDLEHASQSRQDHTPNFDLALLTADPALWAQITQGEKPDIFPENGQPNPRATELLETYLETTRNWSFEYGNNIRDEIAEAATGWAMREIDARDEQKTEDGEYDEFERTPANLMRWDIRQAGEQLQRSLGGTPMERERNNERFHTALKKIADVIENHP